MYHYVERGVMAPAMPYTDMARTPSISTQEYLRNMNILVEWLAQPPGQTPVR